MCVSLNSSNKLIFHLFFNIIYLTSSYQYISLYLSIYLSTYLSLYLLINLSIYHYINLSPYISTCLSIYLLTYLSIYEPINLFIYLSIYLFIYLFKNCKLVFLDVINLCKEICNTYLLQQKEMFLNVLNVYISVII